MNHCFDEVKIRDLTVSLFDAEYSATNLENPEKGCQKFDF